MWKFEYANQVINEKGLKKTWLAKNMGIGRSYFSQCLGGSRKPSYKVAAKLAMLLQVPVESIYELGPIGPT